MLIKYRRFVTSSVGLTFLVVGVTGVIFKLFFKTHVLEEIHGWLGLAMFAAALLHIAQNWRSLAAYFRDWRVVALIAPVVLAIAFLSLRPEDAGRMNPRQVLRLLTHAKTVDLARVFDRDPETILLAMKADGLQVHDSMQTIEDVARANARRPDDLLSYFVK